MKRVEKGYFKRFDYLTLILIVALLIMGILAMLNSLADPSSGDMTLGAKLASLNLYYPLLQLAWFAVGLAAAVPLSFTQNLKAAFLWPLLAWGLPILLAALGTFCFVRPWLAAAKAKKAADAAGGGEAQGK